jgi:hypothetical protein
LLSAARALAKSPRDGGDLGLGAPERGRFTFVLRELPQSDLCAGLIVQACEGGGVAQFDHPPSWRCCVEVLVKEARVTGMPAWSVSWARERMTSGSSGERIKRIEEEMSRHPAAVSSFCSSACGATHVPA